MIFSIRLTWRVDKDFLYYRRRMDRFAFIRLETSNIKLKYLDLGNSFLKFFFADCCYQKGIGNGFETGFGQATVSVELKEVLTLFEKSYLLSVDTNANVCK